MTQEQKNTIEKALERAAREGIRIIGRGHMTADGSRFWLVSSKTYATTNRAYIVRCLGDHLECNCQASDICKHRAVVHVELKAEAEAREETERKEAAQSEQQEITERLLASLTPEEREHREMMDAKMAVYGYTWNEQEYRYEYTESAEERNAKGQAAYEARIATNKAMYAQERAEEEAEHLLTLPRELTGATESQESKLLRLVAEQQRAAEAQINNGFKQRMVERIREADALMGRHTELGPTLRPYDFVDAQRPEDKSVGFYFDEARGGLALAC